MLIELYGDTGQDISIKTSEENWDKVWLKKYLIVSVSNSNIDRGFRLKATIIS